MIKFIKYLIPVLLSLNAFSQENCYYAYNENLTGTCELFYLDGSLKSSTSFENGIRHGFHKEYYQGGQIAAIMSFEQEEIVGNLYRFYPDSSVQLEILLDSLGSGVFHYFNNQGKLIREGQFVDQYRDGVWKEYNAQGDLTSEETYSMLETRHRELWDADMLSSELGGKHIVMNFKEHVEGVFLDEYKLEDEYVFDEDAIVDSPDVEAQFVGGQKKLQEFIIENVMYPADAIEKNITGKVYVSFIVNRDGSLVDIKILKSASKDLDQEAIRLISKMPNWEAAVHRGNRVRQRCILPITFSL